MEQDINKLIAERAYYYYVERGCVDGYDQEDWIRAEREIKAELAKKQKNSNAKSETSKSDDQSTDKKRGRPAVAKSSATSLKEKIVDIPKKKKSK